MSNKPAHFSLLCSDVETTPTLLLSINTHTHNMSQYWPRNHFHFVNTVHLCDNLAKIKAMTFEKVGKLHHLPAIASVCVCVCVCLCVYVCVCVYYVCVMFCYQWGTLSGTTHVRKDSPHGDQRPFLMWQNVVEFRGRVWNDVGLRLGLGIHCFR